MRAGGRVSGGIAAATGGIITAQEMSVAGLLLVPFELAALTALVVVTEVKVVTELHHVAGRAAARRAPAAHRGGDRVVDVGPGRPARPSCRRRCGATCSAAPAASSCAQHLRARFTRNLTALAPLLTGAVAAGYLNRKATLAVGTQVARDLGLHP